MSDHEQAANLSSIDAETGAVSFDPHDVVLGAELSRSLSETSSLVAQLNKRLLNANNELARARHAVGKLANTNKALSEELEETKRKLARAESKYEEVLAANVKLDNELVKARSSDTQIPKP